MNSLTIPYTGMTVELSPRWGSSLPAAFPWLVLAIIPLLLVLWLYRTELTLVSLGVARSLLALRITVIVLLLTLVCLQPQLLPAFQPKAPDRVLLLIDRTGSMDALDPQRPAIDKLRLARALNLATDIASDLQVDEWIAQYGKSNEIQWVDPDEQRDDPVARQKLEKQRKQKHDDICQRVDALSRSSTLQKLLAKDGGQLLQKLGKRFQVEVIGFAQDVWQPPTERPDEVFRWPDAPSDKNETKPNVPGAVGLADGQTTLERSSTDFNRPLSNALEQAMQGRGTVRGVILCTDGRQNRGEQPFGLAGKLRELKAPIYPVGFGTQQSRQTLAVANIEAPSVVLKDPQDAQTINALVKANLRLRGVAPQVLAVELKNGDQVLGRQTVAHNGVDRDQPVYFPISLDKEGPQKLTVEVLAPQGWSDRTALKRQHEITVIKEQAEVMMIEGEARWEYHYVSVALSRDKLVKEVKSVIFDQPRIKKVPEEELKKQNWPALTLPADPNALADFDTVVLGDVSPAQFPLEQRQRLARYVRDGGTLVVVAGKRSMPMLFPEVDPNNPLVTDPLHELLPITDPRIVQSRSGFPVTLTDEGKDNPLLQLEDRNPNDPLGAQGGPGGDLLPLGKSKATIWDQLPPHYWAVVGKKKPAATALAFYPGEVEERLKDKTRAEREASSLIAWQTFGKGRVLFVGLDSTWRWRFKVGDKHHHRFWGQLIRWATADKLLPGGTSAVRFGTPRTTYEPGQDIDVRVRLAKELEALPVIPAAGKPYQAKVLRLLPDGREEMVGVVPLAVREGQPRLLEGKARDLPHGAYRIELDIPALGERLKAPPGPEGMPATKAEFVVAAPPSEEMLDVATDWDLLKNLADKSGSAKVYTPEDASNLVDDLNKKEERALDRTPRPLWLWWPTLIVILALLTIEWVARKWSGLP